jgi:hypothetical protein
VIENLKNAGACQATRKDAEKRGGFYPNTGYSNLLFHKTAFDRVPNDRTDNDVMNSSATRRAIHSEKHDKESEKLPLSPQTLTAALIPLKLQIE